MHDWNEMYDNKHALTATLNTLLPTIMNQVDIWPTYKLGRLQLVNHLL
jgi:hypothetical protein